MTERHYDFTQIPHLKLSAGKHDSPKQGLCFYEAAAFFAGEPHSDRPQCVCPILTSFGISLNDNMNDESRNRLLLPIIPLVVGTRGTVEDERCRAEFLTYWIVNKGISLIYKAMGQTDLAQRASDAKTANDILQLADLADRARALALARADRALARALADLARALARADRADLARALARADLALALALARALALALALARADLDDIMVEGLRKAILIGPHEGLDLLTNFEAKVAKLKTLVEA
jgi:hypothetical protein